MGHLLIAVVVFLVQGFEVFGHDVVKLLEEDLAISLAFTIVVEEELPFFLGTHPLYIYIYIYICMYVYMYVCIYIRMYVCMYYTYIRIYPHTYTHTHMVAENDLLQGGPDLLGTCRRHQTIMRQLHEFTKYPGHGLVHVFETGSRQCCG